MDIRANIAEEKMRKTIEKGEFKDLTGAGKPLKFEDETWHGFPKI